ncbi:MAG: flagellar basal body rod protein FlgB [Bdellovibrionales bacterium]
MTMQNISLFQALGAKMDYLDHRQKVIAQNIANADTPNYRPKDLTEVDFGRVLTKVTKDRTVRMESTNTGHMPAVNQIPDARNVKQKVTYEVAPGENAVILEEQMLKANQVSVDHGLMLNIMKKNVGMLRTALGNQQ